jgi:MFS transporter, SHS family, lactate transporter
MMPWRKTPGNGGSGSSRRVGDLVAHAMPTEPQPASYLTEAAPIRREHWHAVVACFLGWTLDAFDFFVVVFVVDHLTGAFGVSKTAIVWTLTATLAMRPVGAFIFGLFADRYGRRLALMTNVLFYSLVEVLCGFSPNFTVFLILRALYGIGMGGEWGVGASLAMETAPRRWRGALSGILQSGYSIGYLMAAVAARFILPVAGWRWMFWAGVFPAALAFYIRAKVPESAAWLEYRAASFRAILKTVGRHWKLFFYILAMMALMVCLAHGTQDLYPDFLIHQHGVSPQRVSDIAIFYNLGAVLGGVVFGHFSERFGRRLSMVCALALSLVIIPFWAFGGSITLLALGAFIMQVGVQGAWGVIPAHLNELAPDSVRGLLPGFAYQLGIVIASPTDTIEYTLRDTLGYAWAMAGFQGLVIIASALIIALGGEQRGKDFRRARPSASPAGQ